MIAVLGAGGQISIYNAGTTANAPIWVDVLGYYTAAGAPAGAGYVPVEPTRITAGAAVPPNGSAVVAPLGRAGIPTSQVTAVVAHVTGASAATGRLVAYPDGGSTPDTSDLNYVGGEGTFTNQVTVKLGSNGQFRVGSNQQATVTVEVVGYYTTGGGAQFVGLTPSRVVSDSTGSNILAKDETKKLKLRAGTAAVVFNATANAQDSAAGALSVSPKVGDSIRGGRSTWGLSRRHAAAAEARDVRSRRGAAT